MLFRNTLAQSTSTLIGYLFSFILAPVMIARLGLDAFGVWAVTGALATYAGLLDLGVSRSLLRFVAAFDATGDERKIRECVGLGLIVVTVVGLLAAAVAAALAPLLSDKLGVLGEGEMRIVALASVGTWTCLGLGGVLNSVGLGQRRMVPPNVALTITEVLNFTFSMVALLVSTQLTVYAVANVAASLVAIGPVYLAMRHLWSKPYFALPSRALVREVLPFGLKTQIGWLAQLVNLQTDKLIIAFMIDVHAAAVFEIASRVVIAVRTAALLAVSAMVPFATAKILQEGHEVIGGIYRRYTLRACALAFPLFSVVSASTPFLLIAWLGSTPTESILLVPFLSLGYFVNSTTAAATQIAIGAGRPGIAATNPSLIALMNVAFTVALAPVLGLWGVASGTFLALTLGTVLFNVRFLRLFDLPSRDLVAGILPTGLLALALALPPAFLALLVGTPDGRLPAILWLAVSIVVYVLPYWLIATRRGFLPAQLEFPPWRQRRTVASDSPRPIS